MKKLFCVPCLSAALALTLSLSPAVHAAIFTSNASISFDDTSLDGQDIVVIGCTLTVDGAHSFSDILLLDGATLTHTFSMYDFLENPYGNSQELSLIGTNAETLLETDVNVGSIAVTDTNGTVLYLLGVDYSVTPGTNDTTQIARTPDSTIPDGAIVGVSYTTGPLVPAGLYLMVSNNVVIDGQSAIDAGGKGFGAGIGPGHGSSREATTPYVYSAGGGGAYGGSGGTSSSLAAGGFAYGTFSVATNAGSGGGAGTGVGGTGGGTVQLTIGGALWVDGAIKADGSSATNTGAGGGAGGGISLSAQSFGGAGTISANGGAGDPFLGGGGGGGRIVVSSAINEFNGTLSALGGEGVQAGGAGTIYTQLGTNGTSSPGSILVDNAGAMGTNTLLGTAQGVYDLTVTGGAVALVSPAVPALRNLVVDSNSFMTTVNLSQLVPLLITVNSNATVQAGGGISLDGGGYTRMVGPGAGISIFKTPYTSGTGGGHGGYGAAGGNGAGGGNSYDSLTEPDQLGSGGGNGDGGFSNGGAGGGALQLNVSGVLTLAGSITANGLSGTGEGSGGGAGGSLWVTAGTLSGSGTLSANGGAAQTSFDGGGGGGGGRIAVYAGTNNFSGSETAHGGAGVVPGGAGTIYTQLTNNGIAALVVANGGLPGTNTPLAFLAGTFDLTITNGAVVVESAPSQTVHNLLIASNSFLTFPAPLGTLERLTVSGNATIQPGGGILLSAGGYPSGQGAGEGHSGSTNGVIFGSGGGYGGYGGGISGNPYGSATQPSLAGSGGGAGTGNYPFNAGGAGGGALSLNVTGTLLLGGSINANGGNGVGESSGGGSGGSLWLSVGTLSGAGNASANGGAGLLPYGGGGGGGRIAVFPGTNNFAGTFSAHGGPGLLGGGAGTVYIQVTGNSTPQLVLDNGGVNGTNTPMPSVSLTPDLTVTNGAILGFPSSTLTVHNLAIGSNSLITPQGASYYPQFITVTGNATIQDGGGIVLDGVVSFGGAGTGGSATLNGLTTGGGGGHGGYGGASAGGAVGGNSYDNLSEPTQAGSSGGAGTGVSPSYYGGAGGGALQLSVTGQLLLNGLLSANGLAGAGEGSGGGSGGSVSLKVGTLAGSGTVLANGGPGEPIYGGGGGAGGRIGISAITNKFTGLLNAHGGSGFAPGGAGTIYTLSGNTQIPQITLDNGGVPSATNTVLTGFPLSDITITGGARVALGSSPSSIRNLVIGPNSLLTTTLSTPLVLTVTSSATVQAGGALFLDGMGAGPGAGQGPGWSASGPFGLSGSGGGHGGYGGGSLTTGGGTYYDSITEPTSVGSGGGLGIASSLTGGSGGGAIHLTVTGSLTVDGLISADGTTPLSEGAGGGSGGSIWLSAGKFLGAGSITANGGMADLPFGGGGGGGRVAIFASTNSFTGICSAAGGLGFTAGGAGTVYVQRSGAGQSRVENLLFVDNGGLEGTNTPIAASSEFALTISGGAVVQPTSPGLQFTFSSLTINAGSELTDPGPVGQLNVIVLGDMLVQTNGEISLDGDGYPGGLGLGMGVMVLNGSGSGAGYGGAGGASASGQPGGVPYGSSLLPTAFGSGGGIPVGGLTESGPSAGGGALNLSVGGTLTVNGTVTANGNDGELDTGGGSGGSLYLTVNTLSGNGLVSADGGNAGDGGGGGGGRIAVYQRTNNFTGTILVTGGEGANPGANGTEYLSATPALQVVSQSPAGVVTYPVSTVSLALNSPVDPTSLSSGDVTITTPAGTVSPESVGVTAPTPTTIALSFPVQSAVGGYQIQVNAQSIFGLPMPAPYAGGFSIAAPVVSGTVTDSNGNPAAGVTVQAVGTPDSVVTDATGTYALAVPPGWTGSIAPLKPGSMFIPSWCAYTNVPTMPATQNFVAVSPQAMTMTCSSVGGNLNLSLFGAVGATYQIQCSTNLVDWVPYGAPMSGSNAMINIAAPLGQGQMFFRFNAAQ